MPGEIDKELVTAVKSARGGKPMQFAFVPKGQEGKLLVAKKVTAKQVDGLKKEVGATVAFRGRCVGVDGVLVFELVKDPPATLMAQLKKRLKEDAGLTVPLEVRVAADAEAEVPEGDGDGGVPAASPTPTAPGAPPPAPDAVADWKAKLAEWSPAIKASIASKHPKADQIQKFLQDAAGLAKPGGDYVAAILRLKAAFTLASGAAPPVSAAAAVPDGLNAPPAPDAASDWKTKLAEWSPTIKAAVLAKHPKAAQIQKFLQDAAGMAKPGGDFVAAILRLKAAFTLASAPAPTGGDGGGKQATIATATVWQDAKEELDKQIGSLQSFLRGSDDPELQEIGDKGLNGVTGQLQVGLRVALTEFDNAAPDKKPAARKVARDRVNDFRTFVETDELFELLDDNPFGVAVTVRQTVARALVEVEAALAD
jgi:hypothetical protein